MLTLPLYGYYSGYGSLPFFVISIPLFIMASTISSFAVQRIFKHTTRGIHIIMIFCQLISNLFGFVILIWVSDIHVYFLQFFIPIIAEFYYAIVYIIVCLLLSPVVGHITSEIVAFKTQRDVT
jgi:hypothetical protein